VSWEQLIEQRKEAIAMRLEDMRKPIIECPYDGEPLKFNEKRQIWFCPCGDFQRR
jgi:hypothetical protein